MSTRRKRILSAALLLPVVLFSVVATSFALWRCQSDGLARTKCCCPSEAAAETTTATLMATGCCEIERYRVDKAPAEVAPSRAGQLAAMISVAMATIPGAVLPLSDPPLLPSGALSRDEQGSPPGRSVLAQKQSLLI